jgi:signal transduction histidine kinase
MAVQDGPPGDSGWPSITASESPWHLALAFGVVVLVSAAHALHDALEGTPWHHTVPPFAVMVLQMVVLTLGHRWLGNRHAGRFAMLAAGVLVSALFGALFIQAHTGPARNFFHAFGHGVPAGLSTGGFWALVFRLPALVRDTNRRSLAAERARREAELAQLRSSLQPHFLLNTLHAVAALTVEEPLVARRLLAALGDLLRDALQSAPEIRPLETELTWLRRYAEILELRHRDSLRFEWDIAAETTAVPLPKLLLQPLLENAVKHGALRSAERGVVIVRTRFTDRALQLVVEDNGPGIPAGTKEGLGLRIVRERIGLAHPSASLGIESWSGGTRATIEIPHSREVRS